MSSVSGSSPPARHVLRSILRRLRTNVNLVGGDSSAPTRQFVLEKSRRSHCHNDNNDSSTTTTSTTTKDNDPPNIMTSHTSTATVTNDVRRRLQLPLQLELATQYSKLLEDLKERQRLYELDGGADVKLSTHEWSRRAAARAGLQLPKLDPELEKDK